MNANWNYPTSIRTGAGRISELKSAGEELGIHAPLLVTDSGLAAMSMVQQAAKHLECPVFGEVRPNPSGADVAAGVKVYVEGGHDGIIAIGGGSGLDAGKAIALMAGQSCSIWDLEDIGDNFKRADASTIAPVIAIPTTAGTGSEVGRASIILDEAAEVKRIIFHPRMLPQIVILDPELTVGLSPKLTAATGMDALSHSLEAFCSPLFHPLAEGLAVEGVRLVAEFLPRAVADGGDLEARQNMLVAASMGATAFQRGLGAMHALAHPLGALYGAHHGMLNAILMPYVLQANRSAIADRITRISRYLDLPGADFDAFLSWVLGLRKEIGIPHDLAAIGIDGSQLERVVRMATEDPSAATNPILFTAEQYAAICRAALKGELDSIVG